MDTSGAPSAVQDNALIISQADSNVDSSRALLSRIQSIREDLSHMSHVHNYMRDKSNREFQKDQVKRNYEEPPIRLQTENDRSHYQVHNFDHIYGAISPTAASALGNAGRNDVANLQTADFEQRNFPVHETHTFSPNEGKNK